jgi:hypothetical protein
MLCVNRVQLPNRCMLCGNCVSGVMAEHGITRAGGAKPDNYTKRTTIMTARSMLLTDCEPTPEAR